MPQVLRLDDGDARVQYASSEAWETVVNSGQEWNRDGTYHRAKAAGAQLFFLFRGRSLSLFRFSIDAIGFRQVLAFLSTVSLEQAEDWLNYNLMGGR